MEQGRCVLIDAVRSVQLLKINGNCATNLVEGSDYIKSKRNVDDHEWEVHVYPNYYYFNIDDYDDDYENRHCVAVKLILASEPRRNKLKVNLSCRLVDPSQRLDPSAEKSLSRVFCSRLDACTVIFMRRRDIPSGYLLVNGSLTVQCTITVLRELPDVVVPASNTAPLPVPPSDLERHFSALWQGQRGTDVSFVLETGERFHAHKAILAARSPIFMAEFFGGMKEGASQSVKDMDADVFKAMLHFIYTDRVPELDEEPEVAMTMAQHLLAAGDRYGLDRLKLICEGKLSGGISIDTAATTLALAEHHNCSLLKAKCIDFIVRSPETLDAIMATEGYNHLVASCPLVLSELLRAAAHGRRT